MRTLAPYAIDRTSAVAMLADCFEIAMRAASGKAIGEIDENGNVVEWVDAGPQERMRDAEYALNRVANEFMRLLAHANAIDEIRGESAVIPLREYVEAMEGHLRRYESDYEAMKTAAELELGIDDEQPYGEEA